MRGAHIIKSTVVRTGYVAKMMDAFGRGSGRDAEGRGAVDGQEFHRIKLDLFSRVFPVGA